MYLSFLIKKHRSIDIYHNPPMSPSNPNFNRWAASQKPRSHTMYDAPAFYRNLEEALDVRRENHDLHTLVKNTWAKGETVDFFSNDSLSFGASGRLRKAFDEELARNPNVQLGAGGSRLADGNYDYIEAVEQEIADYHGVEAALIVGSACNANCAVFEAIPQPGDAIVYDEFVHPSIVDGMSRSLATTQVSFAHNDVDSFRQALIFLSDSQSLIKQGKKCVLIVVESFYSIEGDMSPLTELVQIKKEIFPHGNAQFIVDEAHSMGVVGKRGLGYVNVLNLDSEIAIKTHTFGKAFGSIGGVILGSHTVKNALVNFSRSTVITAGPAFHQVAAIRAGYSLLPQPETEEGRANIQHLVTLFFQTITSHPIWPLANKLGIISIPLCDSWDKRPFQTQMVPLWTRDVHGKELAFYLEEHGYAVFPVRYKVKEGMAKLRIIVHAGQTGEEVVGLVRAVCGWAGGW
ncbi:class II aminotransferase 8-amino-7-oxononanoate synthase [Botrytis cinerea]